VAVLAAGSSAAAITVPAAIVLQVPEVVCSIARQWGVIARVQTSLGEHSVIRGHHLKSARLLPADDSSGDVNWNLSTSYDGGSFTVRGKDAMWLVGKFLARINRVGGGKTLVNRTVARLEHDCGNEGLFQRIAAMVPYAKSAWARHVVRYR
jgi:hypothetical protein